MVLSLRESNAAAVFPSRVHSGGLYILRSIVMACVVTGVAGCATQSQQAARQQSISDQQIAARQLQIEERWGVEIQSVRLTAAEYMLDFRYRVLDADKAAPILDRHIKPHVIVERSGAKLQVPISSLRIACNRLVLHSVITYPRFVYGSSISMFRQR